MSSARRCKDPSSCKFHVLTSLAFQWVGFHKGDGTKQDNKLPVAVLLGGRNRNTVRIYKCPHCQYGVVGIAHAKNCGTRTDN